jgi:predicted Rossmann fold flavoprotein
MGATDFSQSIAKQFGLKTIAFRPALVPFTFSEETKNTLFKELSGLYVPAIVSCNGSSFRENILITHRGLSGPAILQISSYWHNGDEISINLLPDIDPTALLNTQREEHPNLQLSSLLSKHLPKRLVQRLCEMYFTNKPLKQYDHKDIENISNTLSDWRLRPSGTEGMRTAEVAIGGVDCDELSSKTFECKHVKGLYFIGEAIDVTGHLGGFNFQWAWASGWCAGQAVAKQ